MTKSTILIPACVIGLLACGPAWSGAPLTNAEMLDFVAQSLCTDASGKPTLQVPVVDDCRFLRPQRTGDVAVYFKRDWPDHHYAPHYVLTGHQESDSVVVTGAKNPVVEQTLDFGGDGGHAFGRVDREDGGQVVVLAQGWASIVMTQDANSGIAWFVGGGCQRSKEGAKLGWLAFKNDVPSGRWAEKTNPVATTRSAADCPTHFGKSYIRYRREQVSLPIRLISGAAVTPTTRTMDMIISEHYGNADNIANAFGLERFYFARHLGWIRWERWENLGVHHEPKVFSAAQNLSTGNRCPSVEYSSPPGPNWIQVGCRMWTTIVKNTNGRSLNDYHWHAFQDFNWGHW